MSNYVEYNDTIAFHPGYYIKEIVDESGLTQEDFAKRLDTTPKNLSLIIRGEQRLSIDIAMKLSRMLGTSISYWLNIQNKFDSLMAAFNSDIELSEERKVFSFFDYKYFRENYSLPDFPRCIDKQIKATREFLKVSSLTVFKKRDLAVSFRSSSADFSESNIVKANTMVQIAINKALKVDAPKFNRSKFEDAVQYALTLTQNHADFYSLIYDALLNAGVVLVIMPNIPGSKINGATKKIGNSIMLMVNDRRLYSDTFWFTLFHEFGHIINGTFGISFEKGDGEAESIANRYAADMLIPPAEYSEFVKKYRTQFDVKTITNFATTINRDPGIVLGRLQNDNLVNFNNATLNNALKHKYKVITVKC